MKRLISTTAVVALSFTAGLMITDSYGRIPSWELRENTGSGTEADRIHADIDAAVAAYREAYAQMEGGSTEAGERMERDALTALDEAVAQCQATPGCGMEKGVRAYREVIGLQDEIFDSGALDSTPYESWSMEPIVADRVIPGALNGLDLEGSIELNRYVNNALHDWLTWKRPTLMRTFANYAHLREQMVPAFAKSGIPEALLFGILAVESEGKVHAYSRAGAAGPMQFMRATGNRYGLQRDGDFDERMDPTKAAQAAAAYLNDQFERLDHSLEKTLAAYNAGENRLYRMNQKLGGMDFWSPQFFYALPRDTRKYVPDVLAAAWLYLHPQKYKLTVPQRDPGAIDLVLEQDMSLSEIAICLGNADNPNGWFRALRNLNPRHSSGDRLSAGTQIRIPRETAAEFEASCNVDAQALTLVRELRDASESRENDLLPHVVRRGDTLSGIAGQYPCASIKDIATINDIAAPRYILSVGKELKIPACS